MKNKLLLKKRNLSRFWMFFLLLLLGLGQSISAQTTKIITGNVIESDGNMPLPGVNVIEKGTSNGTVTDFDGNFTLDVSNPDATLVFSYLGFSSQEVSVSGQNNVNITLNPDAEALEEVVVVGYGTVQKKDLTGAVGTLDEKMITERNVTDPMQAIQGNVAGVAIQTSTGRVGDPVSVTIRGKNSINSDSQPLYVVDGVPTDGIDFLNPNDIARIDILKDASSTAIYGSRGSNGVIIVSTKSGANARGKVTVSFDSFYGIKNVARLPKMMDTAEWFAFHQHAYLSSISFDYMSITPEKLESTVIGSQNSLVRERVDNDETFDWYDAVLKSGMQSNNYLQVSGTSDSGIGYNIGLGVQSETGNIDNESLDKYTFKTSVNHKVNDKFATGGTITVAKSNIQRGSNVGMREAFRLAPVMTPYGLEGELYPQPGKLLDEDGKFLINKTSTYNPLLEIANSSDETKRLNIIGNIYAEYSPLTWLTFRSTLSAGNDDWRRGRSWGALTNTGISNGNLPSGDVENYNNFNYTWDNQINIIYDLNEVNKFNLLLLGSLYESQTETSFLSSQRQPFDTGFQNLGSGEQSTFNLGTNYFENSLVSFAARLNYSFNDKILITLSGRYDGSSLLAEGNQWDFFPSAAIAYRLSEESFMKNQNFISNLKFRLGYGYTGNNIIDPYSTKNTLDNQVYYDFNGSTANGWLPSRLANTQLGWEKTREFNVGVDFGFLNNRIFGSLDFYDKLSEDLLFNQQLPIESGGGTIAANVGSVSNKGVELGLTGIIVDNENVRWEMTLTYAKNKNSIEELYGDGSDDIGNGLFIGEAIDAIWDYRHIGNWQANERDEAASYGQREGQVKVLDVNNDGKINNDDKLILGTSAPDWTGGLNTRLTVGNFDLTASAITNQGVFVLSSFHQNFANTSDRGRQKLGGLQYYVPENGAGVPSNFTNEYPSRDRGPSGLQNSVFYEDADFVKIKNIAIGYTFNRDLIKPAGLSYLRIYANVLDPFVFTDYEGYDPEWAGASLNIGRVGAITYQLGLSVKF
ncbi:MAG: TonB-dependent receptor [Lutimonas sp.]